MKLEHSQFGDVSGRGAWGIRALSRADVESLHAATLHVLWSVGIKVEEPLAAEILAGAGATVEKRDGYSLARLPESMVDEAIASTPGTFTLCGRRPEDDFLIEPGAQGFTAGFGEHVKIVDLETKEVRPTTKRDLGEITRIQDHLDVLPFVERAACSSDKPPALQAVHNFDAMVRNTSKHVFLGFGGRESAGVILDMAEAVSGGAEQHRARPIVTCLVCPTSPLGLMVECTSSLITAAERGTGIAFHPMSLSGASSPGTPVGVVVQHNAEALSGVILAQAVRRGTPSIMAFDSTIMDLRRSASPIGVPELALHGVAGIQLAQYYGIPTWAGACASDSKLPDAQQGYDFTLTALPLALAGANIVYGVGAIDSVVTFDYASMIMGAEQARRIQRLVRGIDMSGLAEAVKVIEEIGAVGDYISHDHTFDHMREMSSSDLFDRHSREAWEVKGSRSAADRAYEEARRILASHEPAPLSADAAMALQRIVADREDSLGV